MKRTLLIATALLALAACRGTIDIDPNGGQTPDNNDPDDNKEVPEEYVGPYTLSADKTEVEASGADIVTFSLMDKHGRDVLLDRKALQKVNILTDEGFRVERMETSTSFIANGTYNFYAKFQGEDSENKVRIVAMNRGKYEKFHKNVAIYKATATWCQYCPSMTRALDGMNEDSKAHSVELAWHSSDSYSYTVPGNNNDCGSLVAAYLSGGQVALPTVVLDAITMATERSSSYFNSEIRKIRAEYPATCGIKVSTDYTDGKLNVNAELTSSTGGEYDLGCAILLNDQVYEGGTADEGKYTHIVIATSPNYLMYSSSIKEVAKDGTLPYEMSVELGGMDVKDISVAVFALVKHGDAARIDNIVEVNVGESVDYVYNE